MIEPQSRDELNAILDLHLEELDTEERQEMMLEFYNHVRTYIAEPDDDDIAALRKVVYARIRDLFESEGIQFASREVRVRMYETDEASANPDDALRQRAAAAAARQTSGTA